MKKKMLFLMACIAMLLCISSSVCASDVVKITGLYNSKNGADLRWKAVPGIDKYVIYRTNAGKRTQIATVPVGTTTYMDTSIKDNCWGKVYVYSVAINKNGKTYNRSEGSTLQRLAPMKITSLKSNNVGTADIQFAVETGANKALGYEVQYAKSTDDLFNRKGTYKAKTLDGRKNVKATISGLSQGQTYYFRVRAYVNYTHSVTKKVTKTWSQYSNVKSVKIKTPAPTPIPTPSPTPAPAQGAHYIIKNVFFEYYKETYSNDTSYDAIVTIQNTGTVNLFLKDASFAIETPGGVLVASADYVTPFPQVIAPTEYGYFFVRSRIASSISTDIGLRLVPNLTIKQATNPFVNNPIVDVSLSTDDYGYQSVVGRVRNNSGEEKSIPVYVILLDQNQNAVGIDYTYVSNVAPGNTKSFEIPISYASRAAREKRYVSYRVVSQDHYYQFN